MDRPSAKAIDQGRVREELLGASDEQIDAAVRTSDAMALRGLIYQLTGDEALASLDTVRQRIFMAEAAIPATAADAEAIFTRAAAFLKRYRDEGALPIGPGPEDRLAKSLALAAGQALNPDELDMWIEETAIDAWARSLVWPATPSPEALNGFSVAVIGAGMGGLGAAVQLQRAGIPFVILEKNDDVGGTWFENRYPGARVDTPSRAYTHIFGADYVFDYPFSPQDQNEDYFRWVADTHDLRRKVEFRTEVRSMTWSESEALWIIEAVTPDGPRTWRANGVISATGLLARPNIAEFPGEEAFKGPIFHTARWPRDLDYTGKRVAVIGTGATGYQMVPEMAREAEHVVMVQRKPQWIFEVPGYLAPLNPEVTWLDRNLPYHINFMRFRTNWLTGEHVYGEVFNLDPAWTSDDGISRSALNADVIAGRKAYITEKFAGRPDLAAAMTPPHPPFSARPILVDAGYNIYDALLGDKVTLASGSVDRITQDGLVVAGQEYAADIIVKATGFRANDLLWPMEITGRDGLTVEQLWAKDGCRAHVAGSTMPGFPNMFVIYGPNTNPAQGGGIVNHEEMVTRFALECFANLILTGQKSVEVSQIAFDAYNAKLDQRERLKIYTDDRAQNFFMNNYRRSSVMCPFGPSELWKMLREQNQGDMIFS
ncbi:MAG: NAD(P)/FAD-dependent oxidoreductase [Novosphingobium sp.]|uniref:flavin-containing monooxygenase n=1 Tax=Novosphingobium sp. TaxID=1874826 RepID=UPI002734DA70|nr:NAD(P)/FAD-dependent oxidoreductase [Novosphingobium sp.]MDP3550766.1 NAD(P)/FAD-dependent oxidoreductase [Novosphingobium sp.]